jgi:hypothetical protein
LNPGPLDHITIYQPMTSPAVLGNTSSVCFHPNGPAIQTQGNWIGAMLYDAYDNPTTSSHTFRVSTGDPLATAPDLTTTSSALQWGQCATSPIADGVTFHTAGTWTARIIDLSNPSIPTSNPQAIVVNSFIRVHMATNGAPDTVPAGGATITVTAAGQPGGTVTTTPATVAVSANTTYVLHSTAPAGYSVSYTSSSYNGPGKEVQVVSSSNESGLEITFNYTPTILLASWLGDYDPPSATPSGAGIGQWGQVHCGEAARIAGACPAGAQTKYMRTATACTSDANCSDPLNPTCNSGLCSHTSGATGFVSLTNNVQPISGRFQIVNFSRFAGGHSLRVEVDHGDTWSDANDRNELTRESDVTDYSEGQEGWFSWSSNIGQLTFENPDPANVNPFNNITQWHNSGQCGSQPLGFGINVQSHMKPGGANNVFGLGLSSTQTYMDPGCDSPTTGGEVNGPCTPTTPPFSSTSRNIWVANETQPALPGGAALAGKWLDFLLHVKYSTSSGFVELWYRTDPASPYQQQGLSCTRGALFTSPRCTLKTLYTWPAQSDRGSLFYLSSSPSLDFCYQDANTGQFAYGQVQHNDVQQGWYRASQLQNPSVIFHDGMTQGSHFSNALPSGSSCQCLRPWANGSTICENDDQPCPF